MLEYSINEIQELMKTKKITSEKLVRYYLERIAKIDKGGPKLNSIIELNPNAIQIAKELDKQRIKGTTRGPLHGIPILIKDNITTADKMKTTAGSLAFRDLVFSEDAFIVRKLRMAGAIILGKTNLSEWANFRSTRSTSGWSSRGGQTKNPYILNRSPCGSSSGSAVATAANLCVGAIGTETDGSIICPSHMNSLIGIKPTIGLVSRTGIIPISHTQDTAGPITKTVEDAAILLNTIVGEDLNDPSTLGHEEKFHVNYSKCLKKDGLKGARIGIARNYFGRNNFIDEILEMTIKKMSELGAEIVDPTNITTLNELNDPEFQVLLYDFKHDINEFLKKYSTIESLKTLEDIINFNDKHKEKVMPYFGQELFNMAQEKGPLTNDEYQSALEKCHKYAREEGIDKLLSEFQLDAIFAPSGGFSWIIDYINGDHFTGGSSSIAAIAGYPNITLPVGYIHNLPIGVSFFGGAFQEPKLIQYAYALEQALRIRQPPRFLNEALY